MVPHSNHPNINAYHYHICTTFSFLPKGESLEARPTKISVSMWSRVLWMWQSVATCVSMTYKLKDTHLAYNRSTYNSSAGTL
jgi:hypothetical protein